MNSSFIDKCLHNKFHSHKYQLSNSFIYNEESDFFSITNTGYAQEIEVKISKSDFKADFKKRKHKDFEQIYKGQKLVLRKGYTNYKITDPIMQNAVGKDGKGILIEDKYGRKRLKKEPSGRFRVWKGNVGKDSHKQIIEGGGKVEAISTNIRIFRPKMPNKFWFAVPEGLISKEDVPEYAGLYHITEDGEIKTIKRAPFIHKEKEDLKQVLLDKFYYLSLKLERQLLWKKTH